MLVKNLCVCDYFMTTDSEILLFTGHKYVKCLSEKSSKVTGMLETCLFGSHLSLPS